MSSAPPAQEGIWRALPHYSSRRPGGSGAWNPVCPGRNLGLSEKQVLGGHLDYPSAELSWVRHGLGTIRGPDCRSGLVAS